MTASRLSAASKETVKAVLSRRGALVEAYLEQCLAQRPMPDSLRVAMNYSLLAGGKRLRPVLCLSAASLLGLSETQCLPFAAALEMIHTYSLIHDDLPAMDNDDLRRGKPSSHKRFDEATAILAGDALLTDAFAFMASLAQPHTAEQPLPADRVLAALAAVASAAGSGGMVGGQVMDMQATGQQDVSLDTLRTLHSLKTGALFRAACVSGGLLAGGSKDDITALQGYGEALGAAFQIVDDILDETGDTATLGKPTGSDAVSGKSTYPSLLGLDASRELAQRAANDAVTCLERFTHAHTPADAAFLAGLAQALMERTH